MDIQGNIKGSIEYLIIRDIIQDMVKDITRTVIGVTMVTEDTTVITIIIGTTEMDIRDNIITITGGDIMPTDTIVESAAADYAAGSDWFDGKHISTSPRMRAIRFFGVTGSAAEGDMSVELFVGSKRIGQFYNTATALIPAANSDLVPVGRSVLCPPGTQIHCFTVTASGTNPAGVTIVVDEF